MLRALEGLEALRQEADATGLGQQSTLALRPQFATR